MTDSGMTAMVEKVDMTAVNGVIHVIDGVLVPQSVLDAMPGSTMEPTVYDVASNSSMTSNLTAYLSATGLDSVLSDRNGTFTVFAPTDMAFADADAKVMQ